MQPGAVGLIMRSLKADFKFVSYLLPYHFLFRASRTASTSVENNTLNVQPMVYPDTISVYHKIRARPEADPAPSSFVLDCVVLSHQHRRPAARLEEDIVIYDYRKATKAAMPAFAQKLFSETYDMQQAEATRTRNRIWYLIKTVEQLEKETWDREDAVEDLGSAAF
jgi:hypothetical protein